MIKIFDGLYNVVSGLLTERDKHSYSQYGVNVTLTPQELTTIYRGSWLAKRIVNSVADDMTREWIDVSSKESEDLDFCKVERGWKLKSKVNTALKLARLHGGSVIIIGTKGGELNTELNMETFKQGDLKYLVVKDRNFIQHNGDIESDINSSNFNLPKMYTVTNGVDTRPVHWSRVIRFDGEYLPELEWVTNNRWHDSILQHVLDSVKSYDATRGSIMTMLYEANVDVLKIFGMGDLLATKDGEKLLTKRFQTAALMKSFNRALLLDENDSYEKKSNNFTNLSEIWGRFIDDVCGASEIPVVRLFGQSPGGLNATGKGELVNYYDMISNKQESDLYEPLNMLINLLILNDYGKLPEDLAWSFKPLWQIPESELTTMRKTRAEQDQIYYNMGVVSPTHIAKSLQDGNVYSSMTDEDVELLAELEESLDNKDESVLKEPIKSDDPESIVENE